jgi:tetratricopeptide (TPR) repeat protein
MQASAPSKQPATQASKQSKPAAAPAPVKTPVKAPVKAAPQPRQPSRDEAAALKAFERAHKEFARGKFEAARELFRGLIVQHAGVSEVAARARTYLNIAEARLRSEAALPRDADALYDRGVFEMNRGDYVAAQEMFERALKRDPSAPDTYYALAATRARLGAVDTAIKALEQAVELNPKLRVRAQTDIDFLALRNEPDYERIIFASPRG